MVVRVEYDRSNRVCIRSISNRPSRAVDQGGVQFFYRVPAACPASMWLLGPPLSEIECDLWVYVICLVYACGHLISHTEALSGQLLGLTTPKDEIHLL